MDATHMNMDVFCHLYGNIVFEPEGDGGVPMLAIHKENTPGAARVLLFFMDKTPVEVAELLEAAAKELRQAACDINAAKHEENSDAESN